MNTKEQKKYSLELTQENFAAVPSQESVKINDTPMRQEFLIRDKDMVELVKNIFSKVDQSWWDVPAFEVANLIESFIEKKYRN